MTHGPTAAPNALIGHTGFVGGTLARQHDFVRRFNSTNIQEMAGGHFGLVICAGVYAEKWRANADPVTDAARIKSLTDVLASVTAEEFILISTIDIYSNPEAGGDESTVPDAAAQSPYGRGRHTLELWCRERFPVFRLVRLPALFGGGLRKNALYDLLHDNRVDALNPASRFQWYGLHRLWSDVDIARNAGLDTINLFPEPLTLSTIIDACFPGAPTGPERYPAPAYDVGTRHAALFGGAGRYLTDATRCLGEIAGYVAASRRAGA